MKSCLILLLCAFSMISSAPSEEKWELLQKAMTDLTDEVKSLKVSFTDLKSKIDGVGLCSTREIPEHDDDISVDPTMECHSPGRGGICSPRKPSDPKDPVSLDAIEKRAHPAKWVEWDGSIPPLAVSGGKGANKKEVYIGMAAHLKGYATGTIAFEEGRLGLKVPWGGIAIIKEEFYILTNPKSVELTWKAGKPSNIPSNALIGGTEDGEDHYITRVFIDKVPFIGKGVPSHKNGFFPYEGREVQFQEFEVLCATE